VTIVMDCGFVSRGQAEMRVFTHSVSERARSQCRQGMLPMNPSAGRRSAPTAVRELCPYFPDLGGPEGVRPPNFLA